MKLSNSMLLLSLAAGLVQAGPVTKREVTDGKPPSVPPPSRYMQLLLTNKFPSGHSQLCPDPRASGGNLLRTGSEELHPLRLHGRRMQGPRLREREEDRRGREVP